MSNNWFSDKLGPQVQRYVPPSQQPQPGVQQVIYPPPAQPQGVPQGSYAQQAAHMQMHQMHAIDAVAAWRGTQQSRQGSQQCPKCGGPYLYNFNHSGGADNARIMKDDGTMVAPLARCFTCGYNGRFEQIGQQGTDLGVVLHT